MSGHIIALGGGGFSTESEPGLDKYILDQVATNCPKIGFIGTASGDDAAYILKFYARFSELDCEPSHLDLFRRTPMISDWVLQQDIIFVGGGNTKSMLAVWAAWQLPLHLRSALDQDIVLAGISAGAICWFEAGITDSVAVELSALNGLGFLEGSCCPHYSLDAERKPTYRKMILNGGIKQGIAIDDGAGVHFIDGVAQRIISGAADASAYSLSLVNGELDESIIPGAELISVAI